MPKFIALLRGINVSGHNKIKMVDLKNSLYTLGYKAIQTYLQSGNVIFESSSVNTSKLENQISTMVLNDFGYTISVLVLSKKSFVSIQKNNPFLKDESLDIKKLYTIFFNKSPDKELFNQIKNNPNFSEKMILHNNVIYMYYSNGYGKSKVNNNFFEKKLKVTATTRNGNTVRNLNDKLV